MSFRLISNMKIGRKLSLVIGVFAVGFLVFAGYAYLTIQKIKVNGPLYGQIALQKDLVADVLPPPEFIVESYLTVLQIERATQSSDVADLVSHLDQLQTDYAARHAYWAQHLPAGKLRDTLVKTSYEPATEFYTVVNNELIPAIEAGQAEKVANIIDTRLTPLYKRQRAAVDQVVKLADAKLASVQQYSQQTEQRSMDFLIGVAILAFVLAILLGLLVATSIVKPVTKSVEFARRLAEGDLSGRLRLDQKDEIGALVGMLDNVSVQLRSTIGSVQRAAERVASSSEQIAVNAERLSEGTQNQASNLEETSASVEELSSSIEQVASHAQGQADAALHGSSSMEKVQVSITEISKSLVEISEISAESVENALAGAKAVENVMEGIERISSSSERIGGIVNVIADIADRTNLLALNASIEAARAGEHGRGFAVVADEVSKLAERSSVSTKEIESLIKESVANVKEGVNMAKGSQSAMEQIRGASQKVREMIEALKGAMDHQVSFVKELAQAFETVNAMSQSISASTEEQTTNARQVSQAIENVNGLTQEAAAAAEEMSASTQTTSELALHLMGLATKFKIVDDSQGHLDDASNDELESTGVLDPEQINKAIGAHTAWKLRLRDAIDTGKSNFSADHVRRDDACAFGRWLATLDADARAEAEELGVLASHREFHRTAARIFELAVDGRQGDANEAMGSDGEFAEISSSLIGALVTLKNRVSAHHRTEDMNGKNKDHSEHTDYVRRPVDDEISFSAN